MLTVEVAVQDHAESLVLSKVNGNAVNPDFFDPGGLQTIGEFGANLMRVFGSRAASFKFAGWTEAEGHTAAKYSYQVPASEKPYVMIIRGRAPLKPQTAVAGLKGTVIVARDTHEVLRAEYYTDPVPPTFPMRTRSTVEYRPARVGDAEYLLPDSAVIQTTFILTEERNVVQFHSYRKFAADSLLRFAEPPKE